MFYLIIEEDYRNWVEDDQRFDSYGEAVKEMVETQHVHVVIVDVENDYYHEFIKNEDGRYTRV